jgi:hypothetical protein
VNVGGWEQRERCVHASGATRDNALPSDGVAIRQSLPRRHRGRVSGSCVPSPCLFVVVVVRAWTLSDPGLRAWSLDARLETSAKFGAFGEWTVKSTTPLKATRDTRLSLATKLAV